MPYLQRDDARIYYEVTGNGPPLLLIAGIASDVASWAPVVPLLQDEFRLIFFDNRGAGRTGHSGPIDPGDWAGDALALLDHLDIAAAGVVGHSLGGMIGLRLAQHAPDRVVRLVAAATTANPDKKSAALLQEMAALYESGIEPEAWFRLLFQWLFAPPFFADPAAVSEAARLSAAYAYCQQPADFRRQVEAVAKMNPADPAALETAIDLVVGDMDIMVPPEASRRSFAALPGVTEMVVEGAGHSLHWDRPQAFADAVKRSLSG